jgi:hypothetical protein
MTIHNILIKLLLRNKLYWANKLALNSKIVIKSFYKNSESVLLNSLVKTNAILLENINTLLRTYLFIYRILLFNQLHNITLNKYSVSGCTLLKYDNISDLYSSRKILTTSIYSTINFVGSFGMNVCTFYNIFYNIYFNILYLLNTKLLYKYNWRLSKLPKHSEKITVLRSPHIDKKSREQFEILTHKSSMIGFNLLTIDFLKNQSDNNYIEYIY